MPLVEARVELPEAAVLGEAVVFAERLSLDNTELVRDRVALLAQAVELSNRAVDHLPARDVLPGTNGDPRLSRLYHVMANFCSVLKKLLTF
jgi:cyanate lyase